jgi:hypothetical protein
MPYPFVRDLESEYIHCTGNISISHRDQMHGSSYPGPHDVIITIIMPVNKWRIRTDVVELARQSQNPVGVRL